MIRATRAAALAAAVVAAAVVLSPVSAYPSAHEAAASSGTPRAAAPSGTPRAAASSGTPRAPGSGPMILAVNSRGTAQNESSDPARTKFTFPMYDLATGEEIGTITDDVGGTPVPGVVDVITTYRFTDGEIVNHMPVSIAQDSQKPGWIVVGNRPEGNTIVKATGAYEGRTGKVRLSGVDDITKFPDEIYQDDFWIIELDG